METVQVDKVGEKPRFLITDGTRQLDTMLSPTDVKIGHYFIPDALGHSEHEEIAARIIQMGRDEGKFVAPSYSALFTQVVEELKIMIASDKARCDKFEKKSTESVGDTRLSVWDRMKSVFGFKKPAEVVVEQGEAESGALLDSEIEEKAKRLPFSVIIDSMRMGDNYILANEIRDMMAKGYLNLVSDNGLDYIEPTVKLMETIQKSQRRIEVVEA